MMTEWEALIRGEIRVRVCVGRKMLMGWVNVLAKGALMRLQKPESERESESVRV